MRKVKIEEYWPLIVKGTEEFGQIAVAENPEFNKMAECVYRVLYESFLLSGEEEHASEYGVTRWEKMLGLSHSADMSLDERKAAILTYLSVKLPYTVRVLKQMLIGLLGEDNFTFVIDNDTQVLTIHLPIDITDSQLASVEDMLSRVLPMNLVIKMQWINGLPIDYTPVEYLESTGTQYLVLRDLTITYSDAIAWKQEFVEDGKNQASVDAIFASTSNANTCRFYTHKDGGRATLIFFGASTNSTYSQYINSREFKASRYGLEMDGAFFASSGEASGSATGFCVFTQQINNILYNSRIKMMRFVVSGKCNLVPALDPTGAPCMFDTVSCTPFYNLGTGDFTYPTDASPVMTLDLDEKFYAKRTEHGIRRLYHVPEGCTMSKDEYAAKNGFKEILEPPMPLEGYWVPQWKETETQLICEWVETEPPTEEGIEND